MKIIFVIFVLFISLKSFSNIKEDNLNEIKKTKEIVESQIGKLQNTGCKNKCVELNKKINDFEKTTIAILNSMDNKDFYFLDQAQQIQQVIRNKMKNGYYYNFAVHVDKGKKFYEKSEVDNMVLFDQTILNWKNSMEVALKPHFFLKYNGEIAERKLQHLDILIQQVICHVYKTMPEKSIKTLKEISSRQKVVQYLKEFNINGVYIANQLFILRTNSLKQNH